MTNFFWTKTRGTSVAVLALAAVAACAARTVGSFDAAQGTDDRKVRIAASKSCRSLTAQSSRRRWWKLPMGLEPAPLRTAIRVR